MEARFSQGKAACCDGEQFLYEVIRSIFAVAPSKLLYVSVNWEAQLSGLHGLHATITHLAWQKDANTLRPFLTSLFIGITEETAASRALPKSAVLHRKW